MLKCKQHRSYKGIHKPRVQCVYCWWIYMLKQGFIPPSVYGFVYPD